MKFKKLLQFILALSMCFSLCVPAFATSVDTDLECVEKLVPHENSSNVTVTIDDLMVNSIITYADSTTKSGHYKGECQITEATIGPYTITTDFPWIHTIEFDWTARTNSNGDYYFYTVTHEKSGLRADSYFLYTDVKSTKTSGVYTISADKKSITFSSTYDLQWRLITEPTIKKAVANIERIVKMQDLI